MGAEALEAELMEPCECTELHADALDMLSSVYQKDVYRVLLGCDAPINALAIRKLTTGIPRPKVYQSLNVLMDYGLVERSDRQPYHYWRTDVTPAVLDSLAGRGKRRPRKTRPMVNVSGLSYFFDQCQQMLEMEQEKYKEMTNKSVFHYLIDRCSRKFASDGFTVKMKRDIINPVREKGFDLHRFVALDYMSELIERKVFETGSKDRGMYRSSKSSWRRYLEENEINIKDYSDVFNK